MSQHYPVNSTTCYECISGCLLCNDGTSCEVCDTENNFTKVAGICLCQVGMFQNDTICQVCGSMPGCLDCNTDGCIDCDPIFGFSLNSTLKECECDYAHFINDMNVCEQCTTLGCLHCSSQEVCLECNAYFWLNGSAVCEEVCGDGFLF